MVWGEHLMTSGAQGGMKMLGGFIIIIVVFIFTIKIIIIIVIVN